MSANVPKLGKNVRSVACSNVLLRVLGAMFCRRYDKKLADYSSLGSIRASRSRCYGAYSDTTLQGSTRLELP